MSAAQIDLCWPNAISGRDVDLICWLVDAGPAGERAVRQWARALSEKDADLNAFRDSLAPEATQIAALRRPIRDPNDLALIARAWERRAAIVSQWFAMESEALRAAGLAASLEAEHVETLLAPIMQAREVLSLDSVEYTIPSAKPDALRIAFEAMSNDSSLSDEHRISVRQLAIDEAGRLFEMRNSAQRLSIRVCVKEHEARAKWLDRTDNPKGSPVSSLLAPLSAAEMRLGTAQIDFIESVAAVLPAESAERLRQAFMTASYGVLAGDPFDYSEIFELVKAGKTSEEDAERLQTIQTDARQRLRMEHDRLLRAVDGSLNKFALTGRHDPKIESAMEADFERWIANRRTQTDSDVAALRTIAERSSVDMVVFDAKEEAWRRESEDRALRQRKAPILSRITTFLRPNARPRPAAEQVSDAESPVSAPAR